MELRRDMLQVSFAHLHAGPWIARSGLGVNCYRALHPTQKVRVIIFSSILSLIKKKKIREEKLCLGLFSASLTPRGTIPSLSSLVGRVCKNVSCR